jgi:hypothetical protein
MLEQHQSHKFAEGSLRVARKWLRELAHFASDSRQQKRHRTFAAVFAEVSRMYSNPRPARRKMARSIARRKWRDAA